MVNYTCERCNKEFDKKSNYLTHINKKKLCISNFNTTNNPPIISKSPPILHETPPIIHEVPPNIENLNNTNNTCTYCNTIFTRRDALKRHLDNRCKIKKLKEEEEEKDKENIFKLLLEKDEEMKKKDEEIKKNNEENKKNNKKLE